MTQEELAARLRERGLRTANQTTVSRIEAKKRPVTLGEATALSRIFDQTIGAMSNPDGREAIMMLLRTTHRAARKSFAQMRNGARDFGNSRGRIRADLDSVLEMFPDRSELSPDAIKELDTFQRDAEALLAIDVAEDAKSAFEEGLRESGPGGVRRRSHNDGEHQEEA
jgi:transcriptional regulator with XRE-family HTH domain